MEFRYPTVSARLSTSPILIAYITKLSWNTQITAIKSEWRCRRFMLKHTGPISGVATCGDQFVATAGYDNRVILWNGATGAPLARGFHDHLANQCQFSPCGKYLLSASSDYS